MLTIEVKKPCKEISTVIDGTVSVSYAKDKFYTEKVVTVMKADVVSVGYYKNNYGYDNDTSSYSLELYLKGSTHV